MNVNWYLDNVVVDAPIDQGDIFINCPIYSVDPPFEFGASEPEQELPILKRTANVVVLSQTCDLIFDEENKRYPVGNVVCALLYDSKTMTITEKDRYGFFASVHANNRPSYHLLGKYEGGNDILPLNYQVVDFSEVVTLPYDYLTTFRLVHGKRLRLNTPHRELLSFRFGNYFARIGLPDESYIDKNDLKRSI